MSKKNHDYQKPMMVELNEVEMEESNGGVGFVVVVGAAVAALVAAVVYTTAGGVTLAVGAAGYTYVYATQHVAYTKK
ncbi:uncharacterized protein (DUF697 family) [Lachnospiraceae bacterium PM6-15]|uniref:hypothetical protein n=1 Tax=Ohessyouella blattaphilus TaxID=2949333 RepID=UPI003E30755F